MQQWIHNELKKIAQILLSSPDDAWQMLQEMDSDYVLVFLAPQKLSNTGEKSLYTLNGGGDDSKKQWFMRIAGEDLSKYLFSDGVSGTDYFWNETLLGKMFPYSLEFYVNPNNNQQSATYARGFMPIYTVDIKYPVDGDGPLRLVHASPSFIEQKVGVIIGVFVYEINDDHVPQNLSK